MKEKMFAVVIVLLCGSGKKSLKLHTFTISVQFPFNFSLSVYLLLYPGFLTGIEGRKLHFSLICYGCCLFIKTFPVLSYVCY